MRILIVEDVPEMQELLREMVSTMPEHEVSGVAGSGAEMRLEVDRNRPELVLLDEVLPGESSLDLFQYLRSLKIPVLFVTGVEEVSQAVAEGALGRIQKPGWKNLADGQAALSRVLDRIRE